MSPPTVLCSNHLPQNSALQREWLAYQEKLKTALECFKVSHLPTSILSWTCWFTVMVHIMSLYTIEYEVCVSVCV